MCQHLHRRQLILRLRQSQQEYLYYSQQQHHFLRRLNHQNRQVSCYQKDHHHRRLLMLIQLSQIVFHFLHCLDCQCLHLKQNFLRFLHHRHRHLVIGLKQHPLHHQFLDQQLQYLLYVVVSNFLHRLHLSRHYRHCFRYPYVHHILHLQRLCLQKQNYYLALLLEYLKTIRLLQLLPCSQLLC